MTVTIMAILSAGAAVLLLVVLAVGALKIAGTLEAIGSREPASQSRGITSYLARISLGVRAIQGHTTHVGPQVTKLNGDLPALAAGLTAIRDALVATRKAVSKQKG